MLEKATKSTKDPKNIDNFHGKYPVLQTSNQYVLNNSVLEIRKEIIHSDILMLKNDCSINGLFDANGKALTYIKFVLTMMFNITENLAFPFLLWNSARHVKRMENM